MDMSRALRPYVLWTSSFRGYTDSELIDSVNSVKGDLKVIDVKCNQLRSKYKDLYSSFHVAVTVNVECFKPAIELFSTAEAWPIGVFVKRYFKPRRNGSV